MAGVKNPFERKDETEANQANVANTVQVASTPTTSSQTQVANQQATGVVSQQPQQTKPQSFSKVTDYLRANQQRGQALGGQQVAQVKQQQADLTGAFTKAKVQANLAFTTQQQQVEREGQQAKQIIEDIGANKITAEQLTPQQTELYKRYTTAGAQPIQKVDPTQYFSNVQQLLNKQRQAGAQQQYAQTTRAGGLDAALLAQQAPVLGQQQTALQKAQEATQQSVTQAPGMAETQKRAIEARYAQEQATVQDATKEQLAKAQADAELSAKNAYEKQRIDLATAIYNQDIEAINNLGLDKDTRDAAIAQASNHLNLGGQIDDKIGREAKIAELAKLYSNDDVVNDSSFVVGDAAGLVQKYASDAEMQRIAALQKLIDQSSLGTLSKLDGSAALNSGPDARMLGSIGNVNTMIEGNQNVNMDNVKTALPDIKNELKTLFEYSFNGSETPGYNAGAPGNIASGGAVEQFEKYITQGPNGRIEKFFNPKQVIHGVSDAENQQILDYVADQKTASELKQRMSTTSPGRGKFKELQSQLKAIEEKIKNNPMLVPEVKGEYDMPGNTPKERKLRNYINLISKVQQKQNEIWKTQRQQDIRE